MSRLIASSGFTTRIVRDRWLIQIQIQHATGTDIAPSCKEESFKQENQWDWLCRPPQMRVLLRSASVCLAQVQPQGEVKSWLAKSVLCLKKIFPSCHSFVPQQQLWPFQACRSSPPESLEATPGHVHELNSGKFLNLERLYIAEISTFRDGCLAYSIRHGKAQGPTYPYSLLLSCLPYAICRWQTNRVPQTVFLHNTGCLSGE